MSRRIDYLDDPHAPKANSLVPSVNCIVLDAENRVLLIRRTDNDNWSLPGGAQDLGESLSQAAVRETREETGIEVRVTGVSGLYSNPRHVVEYTSDGEVRQELTFVFVAESVGGQPTPSGESSEVRWIEPQQIEQLPMNPSMRTRIRNFVEKPSSIFWD